jgi:hypothetical protein
VHLLSPFPCCPSDERAIRCLYASEAGMLYLALGA